MATEITKKQLEAVMDRYRSMLDNEHQHLGQGKLNRRNVYGFTIDNEPVNDTFFKALIEPEVLQKIKESGDEDLLDNVIRQIQDYRVGDLPIKPHLWAKQPFRHGVPYYKALAIQKRIEQLWKDNVLKERQSRLGYSNDLQILPEEDDKGNYIFYHGTNRDILKNGGRFKSDDDYGAAFLSTHPAYSLEFAKLPEGVNAPKNSVVDKPHMYRVRIPKQHYGTEYLNAGGPDIVEGEDENEIAFRARENAVQNVFEFSHPDAKDIDYQIEEMCDTELAPYKELGRAIWDEEYIRQAIREAIERLEDTGTTYATGGYVTGGQRYEDTLFKQFEEYEGTDDLENQIYQTAVANGIEENEAVAMAARVFKRLQTPSTGKLNNQFGKTNLAKTISQMRY
jgi:hypothetical protein